MIINNSLTAVELHLRRPKFTPSKICDENNSQRNSPFPSPPREQHPGNIRTVFSGGHRRYSSENTLGEHYISRVLREDKNDRSRDRNFAYSLEERIFSRFIYHYSKYAAETEQHLQQRLDTLRRSTSKTEQLHRGAVALDSRFYSPPEITILSSILQQWELLYSQSIVRIFFFTYSQWVAYMFHCVFRHSSRLFSLLRSIYKNAITRSYSQ